MYSVPFGATAAYVSVEREGMSKYLYTVPFDATAAYVRVERGDERVFVHCAI